MVHQYDYEIINKEEFKKEVNKLIDFAKNIADEENSGNPDMGEDINEEEDLDDAIDNSEENVYSWRTYTWTGEYTDSDIQCSDKEYSD